MKRKIYTILSILLLIGLGYAGAEISSFSAKSQDGNVLVKWSVISENNLSHYIIERGTINSDNTPVYSPIARINASGKSYYEYLDKSAYKINESVYSYRLAIYEKGIEAAASHSNQITVVHNDVSSVKRTWGSIKDLFR